MVEQSRPLHSSGSMDYEEMMKTIKYLLDAAWGKNWGTFTANGPNTTDPKNVDYPVIVYGLKQLRPGVIGKTAREIKPRYRYFGINEDTNGSLPPATSVYGQVFDAEVEFEIWEETNERAEKLAKNFRQTMATYSGYLKEKGLKAIYFEQMDTETKYSVPDIHKVRKLTYSVKFEEITEVPTDIFKIIEVVEQRLQEQV